MNDRSYRDAMNRLPFSQDLEAKTLAMLEAASAVPPKEETSMKKPFWEKPKFYAIGGSVLAAAACLLLVVLPLLKTTPPLARTSVSMVEEAAQEPLLPAKTGGKVSAPAQQARKPEAEEAEVFQDQMAAQEAAAPSMDMVQGGAAFLNAAVRQPQIADWNTEEYSFITENRFLSTLTSPLSTFAADVDTASYAKLRSALLAGGSVVADSVRIEEMLNYFSYDYAQPNNGEPFGVTTEIADCPWNPDTKLLLLGLQAEKIPEEAIPPQNLVFLIDVSGSMDDPNKLPLVQRAFLLLLEELQPNDTISIVTYASSDCVLLDGARASEKTHIMEAIQALTAGGGTAGAAGIETAYALAEKHFLPEGGNRVILATDGDLNLGISDEGSLTRLIEGKRQTGVFLSVLGFGQGNYKDNKLEALADHGNGNYAYIDTIYEARKALVEEIGGTFHTVAKDVKLQVEFNPGKVKGYRLIGYENRVMAAEDFANDQKDGGEVGSGHRVTVLYEIVPSDSPMEIPAVETKYQTAATQESSEWLTLNLRAKAPQGDTSTLYQYPVDSSAILPAASDNLRFASAVAEVGMLLRDSEFKQNASYADALERLRNTASIKGDAYKEEFQYLVTLLARENP